MTEDERRKRLKRFYYECESILAENCAAEVDVRSLLPRFPPECVGLTCGAKTRAGTPCKRRDLHRSGRCKLHGGLSTGPKTLEGKRRSALNTGKTYEELLVARKP